MTLHGARAFVTGGTGFIGGRLAEVLTTQFGMSVKALVRNTNSGGGSYRLAGTGAELVVGDITDGAAMTAAVEGCDYVFHCAFGTSGDAAANRKVTVEGTSSLVRAAGAARVRHFVNLSTIVVFGDTPAEVDESFVPTRMWKWDYPHDKLAAEKEVAAEHGRSGLAVTTLRLGSIYGPWSAAFTLSQMANLLGGRVALVNGGTGISNATYVDDVIQAIVLAALRRDVEPEMFIVKGPDSVTWRAFYEAYEAMLGTDSLVSLTHADIRREAAARRSQALRRALPTALATLKQSAEFKAVARDLPLLRPAWKFYRNMRPAPDPVATTPPVRPQAGAPTGRPLHAVPPMMQGFYASQSEYRIDKARKLLGYAPQFDLAKGMALTEQWARWAGIIPGR